MINLGLRHDYISSETKRFESVSDLSFLNEYLIGQDYMFAMWLDYGVFTGKYVNQTFYTPQVLSFKLEHLQRLRIFSTDKEIYFWRQQGQLKGRLRQDNAAGKKKIEVVDAEQILVGTDSHHLTDGFTQISEQRGAQLNLPIPDLKVDDHKKRAYVLTRHYIDFNHLGQAYYNDSRLIAFRRKA